MTYHIYYVNIFLFPAYADDMTVFLERENSAMEIAKAFDTFTYLSGLEINKHKGEKTRIGV